MVTRHLSSLLASWHLGSRTNTVPPISTATIVHLIFVFLPFCFFCHCMCAFYIFPPSAMRSNTLQYVFGEACCAVTNVFKQEYSSRYVPEYPSRKGYFCLFLITDFSTKISEQNSIRPLTAFVIHDHPAVTCPLSI